MGGQRRALIIANDQYDDPELRRLNSPAQDAEALAEVLGDPGVGDFQVAVLYNETSQRVRSAVEDFFVDRDPDDVLLLHFSCHGLKNADGNLFLALKDTRPNRLASSGLPADFVNDQIAGSRAQQIALFLDCCFGGAFPRGMVVRAAGDIPVSDAFTALGDEPEGRARVVVTASSAMQYSFEAGTLSSHEETPSVFTGSLVQGLSTGEADKDGDGWVGLSELFSYVKNEVRRRRPEQKPQLWTFGAEGDIRLGRSRVRRVTAKPLEPEIVEGMEDSFAATRFGTVDLLRERMWSSDLGMALAAWQALGTMTNDDSRKVSQAAQQALASARSTIHPESIELQIRDDQEASASLTVEGPPLGHAVTVSTAEPWLRVDYDDAHVRVTAGNPGAPGEHLGSLTLKGPTETHEVPVRLVVVGSPVAPDGPGEPAKRDTPPEPPPVPPPVPRPVPEPVPGPVPPRWLKPALIGGAAFLVVLGVLLWWGSLDSGDGGGGGDGKHQTVELPQGPPLSNETLVWAVKGDGDAWDIVRGTPPKVGIPLADKPDVNEIWPALSPNRRTVLYQAQYAAAGSPNVRWELHVVGTDGEGDRRLLEPADDCPNEGAASWSPDGKQLAFVCWSADGKERLPGIRVVALDGTVVRTLDEGSSVGAPTWSPDGRFIVYWAENGSEVNNQPGTSLWAVPSEGGDPTRLTKRPTRDAIPSVSPDGQWVVFARRLDGQQGFDIYLTRLRENGGRLSGDGTARMQASVDGADDHDPAWSPDSTRIVFSQDGRLLSVPPYPQASAGPLFPDLTIESHQAVWASG